MSYQQEHRHAVIPQADGTMEVIIESREVGPWRVVAREIINMTAVPPAPQQGDV